MQFYYPKGKKKFVNFCPSPSFDLDLQCDSSANEEVNRKTEKTLEVSLHCEVHVKVNWNVSFHICFCTPLELMFLFLCFFLFR